MTYSLRFEIPRAPRLNAADNIHWRLRQRERDLWYREIHVAVRGKKPPDPLTAARVTITRRTAAARAPDADNLASSAKHLLDGLVATGILEDDNQDVIREFACHWERAPRGKPSTVVEVWSE